MKKMKYYEETSALLHEFSEENQKYFEELWESFNLAGFLYDEDYLREQIYLMMLDFSEAERDGMSAEDYLGKNPKKIMKEILKEAPRSSIKESLLTPIFVLAILRYYHLLGDFSSLNSQFAYFFRATSSFSDWICSCGHNLTLGLSPRFS